MQSNDAGKGSSRCTKARGETQAPNDGGVPLVSRHCFKKEIDAVEKALGSMCCCQCILARNIGVCLTLDVAEVSFIKEVLQKKYIVVC